MKAKNTPLYEQLIKRFGVDAAFIQILGHAMQTGRDATQQYTSATEKEWWYPCGNAHVLIKPRNSKFANWLLSMEHPNLYVRDADYKKAIIMSTHQFNQAMTPKLDWSSTVAKTLRDYDIKAEVWSYID